MPNPAARATGFSVADYVVFAVVVFVSVAIGLYHAVAGNRQRTPEMYLMADRKLRTLPVAMSILVSYVSSILVLGLPAEMYTRGTQLLLRTVGYCLACVVSSLLFVPLFYGIRVTSSFEYLEKRFKSKTVKLLGTLMMLIGNVFYMGLVVYSPSTALEAATGFPFIGSVIIIGIVSTLYTAVGGMKAVIWTDAFQFMVMMTGMLAIVIQGSFMVGGMSKVWKISQLGNRLQFFNFSLDPMERLTFWSTVIGGMFHTLIAFGVGQTSVQRYCSLPTLKQAKRSVFLNIPGLLLINILSGLVGLVVYAYYADKHCDPLKMGYISNANQLVPYFVVDVLHYPGLPGVFLAVLFSGALSSMSSSLNAAAAVTWEDLLKGCWSSLTENSKASILKVLVVCYGVLAVLVSFLADGLGGHVLWASISFTGATSGPTLGVFLLGSLFPWANAKGAVSGFVLANAFNLWVAIGAYIYKPHPPSLSTSVACCNQSYSQCLELQYNNISDYNTTYTFLSTEVPSTNMLTSSADHAEGSGVLHLYGLSFLWYSATGAGITILVGLFVSLCTGLQKPEELDHCLVIPIFDQICCCLPHSLRLKLLCGVPGETKQNESNEICVKTTENRVLETDRAISDKSTKELLEAEDFSETKQL